MVLRKGKFKNLGLAIDGNIQSDLLTAIARSAEDLTNGRGWPEGVNNLLGDLGKITGVSRVWIFQTLELTKEYIVQDYTFEWASNKRYIQIGLPAFNRFKTKIDQPIYKEMIGSRIKGEYQKVITDKLQASWLKSNQEGQNIKSMLTIPITVENEWWGTLGFDDCEREYDWSDAEIALLRTTAFLISSAVLRDRLSAKRKQIDILQKITACSAWQYDIRRGYIWSTSEIFRSSPGKTDNLQFSIRSILKKIHPDDRTKFLNIVKDYFKNKKDKFRCDIQILMECGGYRWVEVIGKISNDSENKHDQLAGIAIDITKRKDEEQIDREKDRLQGALELSGAVCHEMNQPLMSISGYFDLILMDMSENDLNYTRINKIQAQLRRMSNITKKLMKISRYQTKDYLNSKILDLNETSKH